MGPVRDLLGLKSLEDQDVKCNNFSNELGGVTDEEMYSSFADLLNRIKERRKQL
jgi:hypothetical protein